MISARAEDALAGHGALEAVATHYDGHDAVILGASWDTALAGLRELMPVPVVGFTESAITIATQFAERFALVTVGPRAASGHRRIVPPSAASSAASPASARSTSTTRPYSAIRRPPCRRSRPPRAR